MSLASQLEIFLIFFSSPDTRQDMSEARFIYVMWKSFSNYCIMMTSTSGCHVFSASNAEFLILSAILRLFVRTEVILPYCETVSLFSMRIRRWEAWSIYHYWREEKPKTLIMQKNLTWWSGRQFNGLYQ